MRISNDSFCCEKCIQENCEVKSEISLMAVK